VYVQMELTTLKNTDGKITGICFHVDDRFFNFITKCWNSNAIRNISIPILAKKWNNINLEAQLGERFSVEIVDKNARIIKRTGEISVRRKRWRRQGNRRVIAGDIKPKIYASFETFYRIRSKHNNIMMTSRIPFERGDDEKLHRVQRMDCIQVAKSLTLEYKTHLDRLYADTTDQMVFGICLEKKNEPRKRATKKVKKLMKQDNPADANIVDANIVDANIVDANIVDADINRLDIIKNLMDDDTDSNDSESIPDDNQDDHPDCVSESSYDDGEGDECSCEDCVRLHLGAQKIEDNTE
jgi:hypothetical protein